MTYEHPEVIPLNKRLFHRKLVIVAERLDRDEAEKRLCQERQSITIDGSDVYGIRGFVNCARK
jgi:hypothetical protein